MHLLPFQGVDIFSAEGKGCTAMRQGAAASVAVSTPREQLNSIRSESWVKQ
jgi:hypothetical protein